MGRAARIADHIERTVTGPMWHGPALAQALDGVSHAQAAARPIAAAHSIWEIVAHITVWVEIARLRLKGQATGDPTPEEDWPAVTDLGADAWRQTVERLGASHRQLAADARALDDQALNVVIPGLDYSLAVLLRGIVEHGTYHGGQISLLKKA